MDGQNGGEPEPALFVIVSTRPGHEIMVPAASARAAQQAACYLLEHYSHIRTTWHVSRHAAFGPVVVFGCRQPLAGEHLLDQQAHVFTLAAGAPLPSVWAALCGHQVEASVFEALDHGMGRPCQVCLQCWVADRAARRAHPTWRGG